jgi:hypothetical protein
MRPPDLLLLEIKLLEIEPVVTTPPPPTHLKISSTLPLVRIRTPGIQSRCPSFTCFCSCFCTSHAACALHEFTLQKVITYLHVPIETETTSLGRDLCKHRFTGDSGLDKPWLIHRCVTACQSEEVGNFRQLFPER